MLPSGFLARTPPPSIDAFQLGFRDHSPPERLGRLASHLPGFTRGLGVEVRLRPNILPFAAPEAHVLLAAPLVRAFGGRKGTRLLCRLLTSALRSGRLTAASVASGDTGQISWGKFSRFPCTIAGSTLRILDGYGLRDKWPARPMLAPHIRFLSIDPHVCSTLPSDSASRR